MTEPAQKTASPLALRVGLESFISVGEANYLGQVTAGSLTGDLRWHTLDDRLQLSAGIGAGLFRQAQLVLDQSDYLVSAFKFSSALVFTASALWRIRKEFYGGVTTQLLYDAHSNPVNPKSAFAGLALETAAEELGFMAAFGASWVSPIYFPEEMNMYHGGNTLQTGLVVAAFGTLLDL